MKEIKRAIHFDFHTMPGIDDFGENFNAEEFALSMKDANVEYVNVFARCNLGYSYYPTKVGTMYKPMKGNMCEEIVSALKKHSIGVTLYINGGLNHHMMIKNPGIMKINKDGQSYSNPHENMNFFRTPCFNSEYREHLLSEIKEVLQMDPDGIFIDCMIPRSCYCPRCIEKMLEKGIDINDDNAVSDYSVDVIKEVLSDIRKIVPKDKRLFLNSYLCEDLFDYVSHVELECLPTDPGEWGYDFIAAMAPYQRMYKNDKVYMTGCFIGSWGDFGGKKSIAAIENDVYDALLYGYTPSIGDHMHPRDGINKSLYKEIGKIYDYVKKLEKWTDNSTPLCDVAILRNLCKNQVTTPSVPASAKGAARLVSELKLCYDIVNENMDLNRYKLLILPEEIIITDKLNEKLKNFKGSILSCGNAYKEGGLWDYFEAYKDDNTDCYYQYGDEVFGGYSVGIKMKSKYSISNYIEPYFKRCFDGTNAYFYNPPKDTKGFSAVALKGNRAHIAFNAFEGYFSFGALHIKNLIKDIIEKLLPNPLIKNVDLPSFARVSLMRAASGDILHVKTSAPEHRGDKGIIEEHFSICEGKKIKVLGEYKKCVTLPDMKEIKINVADGYTEITLPQICGYMPFLLS